MPLNIAVSIEKGGSDDERVQANSSRMVVVSNSTFVQDNALSQGQQGLDFVSGSVNWLLNREQLIGIAPKVPQTLTFTLDDKRAEQSALVDPGPDAADSRRARRGGVVAAPRVGFLPKP